MGLSNSDCHGGDLSGAASPSNESSKMIDPGALTIVIKLGEY
jgi:hypothetical protein